MKANKASKQWTSEEYMDLFVLMQKGFSPSAIGKEMERTADSIRNMSSTLSSFLQAKQKGEFKLWQNSSIGQRSNIPVLEQVWSNLQPQNITPPSKAVDADQAVTMLRQKFDELGNSLEQVITLSLDARMQKERAELQKQLEIKDKEILRLTTIISQKEDGWGRIKNLVKASTEAKPINHAPSVKFNG